MSIRAHLNQLRMESYWQSGPSERRPASSRSHVSWTRLVEPSSKRQSPSGRIREKMKALNTMRSETKRWRAKLATQPGKISEPLLHPKMGSVYRNSVAELRQSLAAAILDRAEAVDTSFEALIERIVLHPAPEEAIGFVMDIEGDLAGILTPHSQKSKKAAELTPDDLVRMKLVAGAGFEPATFRL